MSNISIREFQKVLAAQDGAVVIDVRTPIEFYEVHVAGAQNIPLDRLRTAVLPGKIKTNQDAEVYLLCRSGGRAQKAAERLKAEGFTRATVVEGGTQAWIDAGLPVERSGKKVVSLERQVRIVAGSLVFIGVILGWFVNRAFFGLSGFVGAGLVFAGVTDFCGMGLLLARMPWNNRGGGCAACNQAD